MTKANLSDWVKAELAQVEAAQARGQVEHTTALRALSARYDSRKKCIVIGLENGSFFLFHPTWHRAWPTHGPRSWLTLKFRRKALGCIGQSSTQI